MVVGDYRAAESPLGAENVRHERMVGTRPLRAESVERAHHAVRSAALDGDLERTEISFAQGLLGEPGRKLASVRFGLVYGKVLDVYVHTVVDRPAGGLRRHNAGEIRVFAVILAVSAAEEAALHVRAGSVPAADARRHTLVTHGKSVRVCERPVPGVCEKSGRGEHRPALAVGVLIAVRTVHVTVESARSVVFKHVLLAYGFDAVSAVAAETDEVVQLALAHLLDKSFPLGSIVILAQRHHKVMVDLDALTRSELIRGGSAARLGHIQQQSAVFVADGVRRRHCHIAVAVILMIGERTYRRTRSVTQRLARERIRKIRTGEVHNVRSVAVATVYRAVAVRIELRFGKTAVFLFGDYGVVGETVRHSLASNGVGS